MPPQPPGTDRPAAPVKPSAAPPAPHWSSEAIFRGLREVLIRHGSENYRLRITSSGKLILTK